MAVVKINMWKDLLLHAKDNPYVHSKITAGLEHL